MLLTSLVKGLRYVIIQGNMNLDIKSISYNSKNVKKNSIFIAISGFSKDGHDSVHDAIAKGANVIIVEKEVFVNKAITVLKVNSSREALARIAVNYYQHPSEHLNTIGITGTNGKTSITYFIKAIMNEAKKFVGTIGTLGTMIDNELIETNNTTPESLDLQRFLKDMREKNTDFCIMEVSSHALQLKRAAYTKFSTGIFTNLSPDHLELHHSMDDYFNAKVMLFDMTDQFNIINADDFYGQKLIGRVEGKPAKTITYGIYERADFYATNINYKFNETTFTLHTPFETAEITIHLPGEIYVSNSLAAIAAAYYNGVDLEHIKRGLEKTKTIPGRFEVIYERNDFKVIVDFAHTEDALQRTLSTLRPFVDGRIILVFGVYADMSDSGTEKRYGMGRVAAEYADFSVVTLDNPKKHDIYQITKETTEAIERNKGKYISIQDREEAIRYAISISEENDAILLAGKGHETSQIIGDEEISFSEKAIVLDAVKNI